MHWILETLIYRERNHTYQNPRADELVGKALAENNPAKRAKYYKELQKIAYEDAMQIYTVHPTGLWAMRSRVKGFQDNPVFMGIYFYPMYKESEK